MNKYDYVFILDYNSLLSTKLFSIYDIENADVRIVTPEISKLNTFVLKETNKNKKEEYINVINKINELVSTKKIAFIGAANDNNFEYKLLEVIVKNYYLKNILIISNDSKKIEKFLPLIPVYEVFNKTLDIGYIDNILKFYEFKEHDIVSYFLNIDDEFDDYDDYDDEFDDYDDYDDEIDEDIELKIN